MPKPPALNINHYGVQGTLKRILEAIAASDSQNEVEYYFADDKEAAAYQIPTDQWRQTDLLEQVARAGLITIIDKNYDIDLVPHPTSPHLKTFAGVKGIKSAAFGKPKYKEISALLDQADGIAKAPVASVPSGKVTFRGNIIRQGQASHDFRRKEMRALVRHLWQRRAHFDKNGLLIKEASAQPRKAVTAELEISNTRLKGLVDTFNRMMRSKSIGLVIKMPDLVHLEAQDKQ